MSKRFAIVNVIVCALWSVLIGVMVYTEYAGNPLVSSVAVKGSIEKQTRWYDIYAGTKKIGFATTTIEKVADELVIEHKREMKALREGQEVTLLEELRCLCDLTYVIKSFDYTSHIKDERGIKVKGEVDSETVLFFLETAEKRKTHKIPAQGKKIYLPITVIPAVHQQRPAVNTAFTIAILNLSTLMIDDVRLVLEEIRPIKVRINVLSIFRYKTGDAVIWCNDKGEIIKEKSPAGITLYSQAKHIAQDPEDRMLFDYTSLPLFEANKKIGNPEELNTLKVRIQGHPPDPELYRNTSISLSNDILTIRKEDKEYMEKNSYTLPLNNDRLSRYLRADRWVLSEDKTVVVNALNMAAVEKQDAFRMARYLTSNLYFTVSPMPMFTLSDSLDIFKTHLGDYLERSVMFASFARASGLPTRIVGGLVYKDGYFYYHAWPEVWFEKWIPVDPSLSQFPADATHIPLVEGTQEEVISIVDSLRNSKIKILEAL